MSQATASIFVHPFQTDMLDEVIHDLLFLAVRDPEDMPGKHVDDVSGIAVSVMQLELINAEETRRLLRFYQCLTINGVFILKPFQIDRLYCILAKSGDLRNLLQRISPCSEKVLRVLQKFLCDPMMIGHERNRLHHGCAAVRAFQLVASE